MACARLPLSSLEFRHALAIKVDADIFEFGEDDLHDIDLTISVYAGLIVEDKTSGIIRLVHSTAQNFLDKAGEIGRRILRS